MPHLPPTLWLCGQIQFSFCWPESTPNPVCVGVVWRQGLIPMDAQTGLGCGLWSQEIPAWMGSCQVGLLLMIKDKKMESFPLIFKMSFIYPEGSWSCEFCGIWVAGLQLEPPTPWQTGAFRGPGLIPHLSCSQGVEGSSCPSRTWLCSSQERCMVQAWQPKEKRYLRDFVLLKGAEGAPPL